jgi:hypothetical protein
VGQENTPYQPNSENLKRPASDMHDNSSFEYINSSPQRPMQQLSEKPRVDLVENDQSQTDRSSTTVFNVLNLNSELSNTQSNITNSASNQTSSCAMTYSNSTSDIK